MTPAGIDQLLAERGIRYDVSEEELYDGNRPFDPDEELALQHHPELPGAVVRRLE